MPFQPGYCRTVEEDVLAREGGESSLLHLQLNHPRRMLHNLTGGGNITVYYWYGMTYFQTETLPCSML